MSNPLHSFAPIRLGPSRPISPSSAQALLATYITSSMSTPYMLPNAKLLASGPSSQGAADGGLVMHNMKRVEAGLRGEFLAPTLELGNEGESGNREDGMEGVEYEVDGDVGGKDSNAKKSKSKSKKALNTDDMWAEAQPIDSYQREQSIEEGEVGSRQAGDSVINQQPNITATDVSAREKPVDKEARKLAKKARGKEERKKKHLKSGED